MDEKKKKVLLYGAGAVALAVVAYVVIKNRPDSQDSGPAAQYFASLGPNLSGAGSSFAPAPPAPADVIKGIIAGGDFREDKAPQIVTHKGFIGGGGKSSAASRWLSWTGPTGDNGFIGGGPGPAPGTQIYHYEEPVPLTASKPPTVVKVGFGTGSPIGSANFLQSLRPSLMGSSPRI